MKKIIWLIMIIFIACGRQEEAPREEVEVKPVKTIVLQRKKIRKEVVCNSDILPMNKTAQIIKSGGELIEINYKNGDRVEKGDIILKIYNEEVISRYERAAANLANTKAQMERTIKFAERETRRDEIEARASYIQAEESLVAAEKRWEEGKVIFERNKQLYEEGLISEIEFIQLESLYQEARSNYTSLKKGGVDEKRETYVLAKYRVEEREWEYSIREARSSYELAKAEYSAAEKDYSDLEVKARIGGYIADMDLDLYDELDENSHLFNLLDTEAVRVETTVSGSDISFISLGDEVEVVVEDLGETFTGKIYEINPQADSGTRRFPIKAAIENPEGRLKSGMYSKIAIRSQEKEGLIVPKGAVMIRELVEYIAVVEDGKARVISVDTGISSGDEIEIRGEGLNAGDRVVIKGQYLLEDGDSVREVE